MRNIEKYYIVAIVLITLYFVVSYYYKNMNYAEELHRIHVLEQKYKKDKEELEEARRYTTPCDVPNLLDPRSCYFLSKQQCRWDEKTKRCDKISYSIL